MSTQFKSECLPLHFPDAQTWSAVARPLWVRSNSNPIPVDVGDAVRVDPNGSEDGADLHHGDPQAIRGCLLEVLDFCGILALDGFAAVCDPSQQLILGPPPCVERFQLLHEFWNREERGAWIDVTLQTLPQTEQQPNELRVELALEYARFQCVIGRALLASGVWHGKSGSSARCARVC